MQPLPSDYANRRTTDIFEIASFVFEQPGVSRQYIQDRVEISATAKSSFLNYLNAALEYGWLERTGTSRGVTYRVTPEFRSEMSLRLIRNRNHTRRGPIPYNTSFLLEYRPNKDYYLSSKQLQMLEAKGHAGYTINLGDDGVQLAVRRFMTDISFNSSRLEGIRANYADTIAFLEEGVQSDSMSPHDAVILRNHFNTIKMVIEGTSFPAQEADIGFSEYDIRVIHSQISDGLLKSRKLQGRIRAEPVQINDSCYVPISNFDVLSEMFSQVLEKTRQIENPFEQAAFISIHLPYLQPFIDCNKRTARIAANISMLRAGLTPFSWAHTSAEAYSQAMVAVYEFNEVRPFAEIFAEAYVRSCDQFEVMMNSREPTRVEVIYAREIAQAVKDHIMDGAPIQAPRTAAPGHARSFVQVVHGIIEDIIDNEMVAAPYRVPKNTLDEWRYARQHQPGPEGHADSMR